MYTFIIDIRKCLKLKLNKEKHVLFLFLIFSYYETKIYRKQHFRVIVHCFIRWWFIVTFLRKITLNILRRMISLKTLSFLIRNIYLTEKQITNTCFEIQTNLIYTFITDFRKCMEITLNKKRERVIFIFNISIWKYRKKIGKYKSKCLSKDLQFISKSTDFHHFHIKVWIIIFTPCLADRKWRKYVMRYESRKTLA